MGESIISVLNVKIYNKTDVNYYLIKNNVYLCRTIINYKSEQIT